MDNGNAMKTFILGIPVDRVNYDSALSRFESFLKGNKLSVIVTPNSEILYSATKDDELKAVITDADMVIPDGIGLVKASRILGCPFEERVTGIDFTRKALDRLTALGGSVYFLGAKPGIAEKAAENLKTEIPGLNVAGTHDGYF